MLPGERAVFIDPDVVLAAADKIRARCAMGRRIADVTSAEFDALFTSFEHTAYRLETLQAYDVSYEVEPYRAFLAGHPRPARLCRKISGLA